MLSKVLFPHWKKNEIIRPTTFAAYWYVIIILCLIIMCGIIAPVKAGLFEDHNWDPTACKVTNMGDTTCTNGEFINVTRIRPLVDTVTLTPVAGKNVVFVYSCAGWQTVLNIGAGSSGVFPASSLSGGCKDLNGSPTDFYYAYEYKYYGEPVAAYNVTWVELPTPPSAVNSTYGNLTINVKQASTSNNIENALIEFDYDDYASISGRTDVNGNLTWEFLTNKGDERDLKVFATGYAYYEQKYIMADEYQFLQIYLTPQSLPNSTNYIKVNLKDASNNLYLENANLTVYDYNSSEQFSRISVLGTEYITKVGSAENKNIIYEDYYNFIGSKEGYESENVTILYSASGQVVNLYLTPTGILNTSYEMWVDIVDGATGYTIGGSTLAIYDNFHKQWRNLTLPTGQIAVTASGEYGQFPISLGRNYSLYASAPGYGIGWSNLEFTEFWDKKPFILALTYFGNVPDGNFSVNVYCVDASSYLGIGGVSVMSSDGQGHTTALNGATQFILPAGSYQIRASKDGYVSTSAIVTGSAGESKSLTLPMSISTITYATTPPTPTVTTTGISGQPIHAGDPALCGIPTDESIVAYIKANIACWGIEDRFSQDLALAAIIILICLFFGSRYGKGLGATIGAAVGFILSITAGLIDLWVFFALVVIAGLIFGLKLYGGDK